MAAGQHNPSRRALLGAAVGFPLIGAGGAGVAGLPLHHPSHGHAGPQTAPGSSSMRPGIPRPGEEWRAALAAFEKAAAAVREVEAATAGYSFEAEAALLPAHDAACAAMEGALGRLLVAPAPDLGAFAGKLELFLDGLEPHSIEEEVLAAIRADVRRLAGA